MHGTSADSIWLSWLTNGEYSTAGKCGATVEQTRLICVHQKVQRLPSHWWFETLISFDVWWAAALHSGIQRMR